VTIAEHQHSCLAPIAMGHILVLQNCSGQQHSADATAPSSGWVSATPAPTTHRRWSRHRQLGGARPRQPLTVGLTWPNQGLSHGVELWRNGRAQISGQEATATMTTG
jgi:hypothetical protein